MINCYRFKLDSLSLEDDAMEDLEAFNNKFKFNSQFMEKVDNIPNINIQSDNYNMIKTNYNFSLEKYLTRILTKLNKNKLKDIVKDIISKYGANNYTTVLLKSLKKSSKKAEFISIIAKIIITVIKI